MAGLAVLLAVALGMIRTRNVGHKSKGRGLIVLGLLVVLLSLWAFVF